MPKKVRKGTLKKGTKMRDVKPLSSEPIKNRTAACWI